VGVDPAIIAAWTAAWAISRGKPAPIPVHGGFFLEDGRPRQAARYVLPDLREDVVGELTGAIAEPWIHLKFCARQAAVAALVPEGWQIADPGFMMSAGPEALSRPGAMPEGYAAVVTEEAGVIALSVTSETGEPAARGRLIPQDALAIFDQIETEEAHRRRGLGSAVMQALGGEAIRRGARRGVLVATPAGRALYLSLGWEILSDYSSIFRPG
jgi:GNAT superfamily N-acetyltransferase